jgi:hypothetical protein
VSIPSAKNISLLQNPASAVYPVHPAPTTEGRIAIVTTRGAGCDGRVCPPDERGAGGRRNRVVLAPRRWCQVLRAIREATEARKPGTPGRSRISRTTIAQGRLDCFGCPVVACVRKVHFLCTQGSRVRPASGLPCALRLFEGETQAKLGQNPAARMRSHNLFPFGSLFDMLIADASWEARVARMSEATSGNNGRSPAYRCAHAGYACHRRN